MHTVAAEPGAPVVERRSSYRHPVCIPCTVRDEVGAKLTCTTENIGTGGALLCAGLPFEVGRRLDLDVHFPWNSTVTTAATVRRRVDQPVPEGKLAVCFDHTVHRSRLPLKKAIERKWACQDREVGVGALIMVDDPQLRQRLQAAIAGLGVRPLVADLPLEALWQLTGEGRALGSVIVDEAMFGEQTLQWLSFLRTAFPHVRRILVCHDASRWHLAQMLSNGAAHGLLNIPWQPAFLEELVCLQQQVPAQ